MAGISKSFPGVRALESVDFEVGEAEIHAFLGENGAGKSTLLKILSGAQSPDTGPSNSADAQMSFASPQAAQAAGIVTIYQEFTLAPDMTVAENVFIGREPGSRFFISRRAREQTQALCTRIGLERSPGRSSATCRLPSSRWWKSPARSR
jgi:inositol transport system ATP-binding protein